VRHVSRAIGSPLTWCDKTYAEVSDLGQSIVKPYQWKEGNCPYCHVEILNSIEVAVAKGASAPIATTTATTRDARSGEQPGRGIRLLPAVYSEVFL
jgi:hypothetical protein